MDKKIFVTKPMLPAKEEYMQMISSIWDSGILTNCGELHRRLEQSLKEYLKVRYLSLCANGHLALESVLRALELKGEVITTPFTFASTTNAIIRCGLTPVFCDIREDDFTLDPEKLERYITENTCAILPVHVYGHLCGAEQLRKIADQYRLPVLYDAAHAFGVELQGENFWEFGTASILSFHATKIFNTVEGGAVITGDPKLSEKIKACNNFGFTEPDHLGWIGGNSKMSEFHAAMGLCNLPAVPSEIQKRRAVAAGYSAQLSMVNGLYIPGEKVGEKNNFAYFPVVFKQGKEMRDRVCQALNQLGYFPRRYFYPLTCDFCGVKGIWNPADITVARRISDGVLCLPIYGGLEPMYIDEICRTIKACTADS